MCTLINNYIIRLHITSLLLSSVTLENRYDIALNFCLVTWAYFLYPHFQNFRKKSNDLRFQRVAKMYHCKVWNLGTIYPASKLSQGYRGCPLLPHHQCAHRACSQAMQHLAKIIIRNYLGEIIEVRYHEVLPRSSLYTWNCAYLDEIIYSNFSFLELFVMRVKLSCVHVTEVFNPQEWHTHNACELASINE